MPKHPNTRPFEGYCGPNFTPIPDQLFDEQLVDLSGAELKVLLYIMRRTFGFKRDADAISLSQMLGGIVTKDGRVLDRGTGLSKPTLLQALRSLVERNIIITQRRRSEERGDEPTIYRLNVTASGEHEEPRPPVVKKVNQGVVKNFVPPVVKKSTPQETVEQKTVRQKTDYSKIRKARQEEKQPNESAAMPQTSDQTASQSVEPLSTILRRHQSTRPAVQADARHAVESYLRDFAREFNDQAPLKSSTTRALRLMEEARLSLPAFLTQLHESRAVTKDRVRGTPKGTAVRNPMSFFFAVLEDRLGLKAEDPEPPGDRDTPGEE